MIQIIFEGFVLGLSSGIYCLGTCLVFFAPYLLVEGRREAHENLRKISLFMLGRFIAYIAFAAIMGFLGTAYRHIFTARFAHIGLILASLMMLFYSLSVGLKGLAFCSRPIGRFTPPPNAPDLSPGWTQAGFAPDEWKPPAARPGSFKFSRIPFFLGIFTGLNPCPPFLVGVTRLWTLNNILGGVALFIAFFIGTSIYMIPLAFVSKLSKNERVRQIGLMVAIISSLWFLFMGITGVVH